VNQRPKWVIGLQFIGLGWYIAASILAGVSVGLLLDGWIGTSPLFLLFGLLLGVAAAFYGTYRMTAAFLAGQDD
jgi:F0F1-type ATP synthase assembly protein I